MCGVCGLYVFDPRPDRSNLHHMVQNMSNSIIHRGPDGGDVWQDPDMPLALGHRRLSILDLSPQGSQPMESQSGRYMISYNGEIYNFNTIRANLESTHKVKFQGHSDTEILLAAIEQWGIKGALAEISGMFAFALWDRQAKALYLARDRMGKKPLYVGWAGSTLVFASELKAICTHPEFRRDIDRGALTSYMRFGYVPAPLCIYSQVWSLLPGTVMALDMRMLRSGQDLNSLMEYYWNPKDALEGARNNQVDSNADDSAIISEFEDLLSTCVRDRMVSDVPLGSFLSGGIDSSTITALMQKNSAKPIKTYSVGFDEKEFDEAQHARAIASHLGTDHHELYIKPEDALEVISLLPEIFDEPFADVSTIPTYLVSKFARQDVTVALSGDGGDEMLGGYNRHVSGPKAWDTVNNIPNPFRKPLSEVIRSVSPSMWDRIGSSKPNFGTHMYKFADMLTRSYEGDAYMSLISTWQKPKNFVQDGREGVIPLVDPSMKIDGLSFAESMMYWDTISYLNGDILTKVDRASMANSLETRAPLLDTRIYDYAWRLPEHYKIRDGKGKWVLREVLKKHIPQELYDRPKQGFNVPIASWLRHELKDWAEDLLDKHELRSQGLFNYLEVHEIWEQHQKGRGNHAQKLWTILMFQSWHRRWIQDS